jgi:hypothetical protein
LSSGCCSAKRLHSSAYFLNSAGFCMAHPYDGWSLIEHGTQTTNGEPKFHCKSSWWAERIRGHSELGFNWIFCRPWLRFPARAEAIAQPS